jgi:hypothetical protein
LDLAAVRAAVLCFWLQDYAMAAERFPHCQGMEFLIQDNKVRPCRVLMIKDAGGGGTASLSAEPS